MGSSDAEMKPDVISVCVGIVLDEEVVEPCFFALEDAVQVASLELR